MTDQNTTIIELNREQAQIVRWLNEGASSDDSRPVLTGLHIEGQYTVSADGFQLRVMETPESLKPFDGQLIALDKQPRVTGDIVKVESIEGKFPDWRKVPPTSEPVFEIELNGSLLANLVKDMSRDGSVKLTFYGATVPMTAQSATQYAILMPMHGRSDYFSPIAAPEGESDTDTAAE
jgi:DNA polymerase III sliding clamp (beta) subunit (PCNA family)